MIRPALFAVAALPLAACAASGDGQAPAALVELYDQLASDGSMELELSRDGTFLELEAEVPVEDVPPFVREAAEARFPGITLTGAEREVQGGEWTWEVKFVHDGRAMELVVDGDGNVLETERELRPSEAPVAVLSASETVVPNSRFVSVESVESVDSAEGTVYHVKRDREGARYKVVLDESGAVLRAVREARAEIEIPLAN